MHRDFLFKSSLQSIGDSNADISLLIEPLGRVLVFRGWYLCQAHTILELYTIEVEAPRMQSGASESTSEGSSGLAPILIRRLDQARKRRSQTSTRHSLSPLHACSRHRYAFYLEYLDHFESGH